MKRLLLHFKILYSLILSLTLSVLNSFRYSFEIEDTPVVLAQKTANNQHIIQNLYPVIKQFIPPVFAIDYYAQTILLEIFYNFIFKPTVSHNERYYIDPNSDVHIDIVDQYKHRDDPILLIFLLGLCGTTENASYLKPWFKRCKEKGYTMAIINRATNKIPTHADVQDMEICMEWLTTKYKDHKRIAISYSAGGNHLIKTLGLLESKKKQYVQAAITVSTNHYLPDTAKYLLATPFMNRITGIYQSAILNKNTKNAFLDLDKLTDVDSIIATFHRYGNVMEYYEALSSNNELKHIKIPTLVIFSKDDGLCSGMYERMQTITQENKNIIAVVTNIGGHVAWLQKHAFERPWVIDVIDKYIGALSDCL